MKTQLQLDLLLVEDNDGHARLIEKNLRRSYAGNSLTHVSDGQEAIDYIRGRGRHEGTPPREQPARAARPEPAGDGWVRGAAAAEE
jgi:CheY-like chemotaxis protein